MRHNAEFAYLRKQLNFGVSEFVCLVTIPENGANPLRQNLPNAALTTNAVYNSAGLPTLSGTTNDAGRGASGISLTKVAIQDGSGNYYDGAGFTSASPVWLTAGGGTARAMRRLSTLRGR